MRALGLRGIGQTNVVPVRPGDPGDDPQGSHLVTVEEAAAEPRAKAKATPKAETTEKDDVEEADES